MNKTSLTVVSSTLLAAVVMGGFITGVPTAHADTASSQTTNSQTSTAQNQTAGANQTTVPNVQDLAASAIIQVQTPTPDSQFSSLEAQYSAPLTSHGAWHGFCQQTSRDITVGLPANSDIQTISIQLEQNPGLGAVYPNQVQFQAYVNGQWYNIGSRASVIPLTDKRVTTQTYSLNVSGLTTNQIRIHFPVNGWVFARNLHVFGTPNPTQGQAVPAGSSIVSTQPSNPTGYYGGNRGIQSMLLAYTGGYGNLGTWTPTDFAPMVTYTNQNGQPPGPMFDTVLFLPFGTTTDTEASWQSYLNDLFTKGTQLDALNTAVGQRNQQTGSYQKEKVVLTIPYPAFADGIWGNVNGQQLSFNPTPTDPTALNAREQAIQWYIQTILNDWNAQGYQNLQLTGFYWNQEAIRYTSPGEVPMVKDAAQVVHQHGYGFYWIPYYDASGLTDWKSFGFDAAWLQPNYMEQGASADPARLVNAVQYAKQNGLGIELELTGSVSNTQTQSLYEQSIETVQSAATGSNLSYAFYAGTKQLVNSYNSTDPATHQVYDYTHRFIMTP